MPKIAKELGALEVNRLTKAGHYAVGGVSGLYLYVTDMGARSWVLRTTVGKKRRHIGLGGYPTVTVAKAREAARQARDLVAAGTDPVLEKQARQAALLQQQAALRSFKDVMTEYLAANEKTWRNPKHRSQWRTSLETYALPTLGKLPVSHIGDVDILNVLDPIWTIKNETASRVRGRIESILDWARVRGYRDGENPARWKGHLDKVLAAPGKIQNRGHFKALAIDDVPAFALALEQRDSVSAVALRFLLMTAARSGEVRGATWDEIDWERAIWTIPAPRMKAKREHRVPLSPATVDLLKIAQQRWSSDGGRGLIFPAPRGGELSDMSLTKMMRDMKLAAVPHGLRSSFRDWVGERTNFPGELAEISLAHVISNKTEAAYRRLDALERRRELMIAWADYCSGRHRS